jgi:hypothetical protein
MPLQSRFRHLFTTPEGLVLVCLAWIGFALILLVLLSDSSQVADVACYLLLVSVVYLILAQTELTARTTQFALTAHQAAELAAVFRGQTLDSIGSRLS